MLILLLALNLSCPNTKVLNISKEPFNKRDRENLSFSKKRCKKIFKDSPCLLKFMKKSELNYWACCGKPDSDGGNCGF